MSLNTKGIDFNGKILQIIPPAPSENTRGGVIAEPKGDNDTVEIKVGEDGKLYAPTYPTGTGTANVPEWAQQPNKPTYTASEVGADASGTAEAKVSEHDNSNTAHSDIRNSVFINRERIEILEENQVVVDYDETNHVLSFNQGTVSSYEEPAVVDSVDQMTDINKQYILASTGTIWEYKNATVLGTVTKNCDDDYTYPEGSRLGSDGSVQTSTTSYAGYTVTPFIDVLAYPVPFTLHLEGGTFMPTTSDSYTRLCTYTAAQAKIFCGNHINTTIKGFLNVSDSDVVVDSNGNATILFDEEPKTNNANTDGVLRYIRFSGKTLGNPKVYVTYQDNIEGMAWVDTGMTYGVSSIDNETLEKVSALNNEGASPATIKLLPKPVLDFYNASDYPDDDYTVTYLPHDSYPCRADIPVPFVVKWNYNEDAMRTTVAVDNKSIGVNNLYTMKTYDATGLNKYPLYNLIPNTTYYYKVTHVMADGSLVEANSGSFKTSDESIRLIYIDGTQNVRDLGGWTALNDKKVKYGKLFRGAALSDSSIFNLNITGKGRLAFNELKVQAELNLGAIDRETSISQSCSYKKIGYTNYAIAFTGDTYKAQFKEALEYIVSCLNGTLVVDEFGSYTTERNVYFHCQGGCDRTGTLSFQLLGLLGVSESDLAKEYELSTFSGIGSGRFRTTTKAVNTYDYVGMVEALKSYNGSTITEKFYNFAIDCGISTDTITEFRNLMLE